ncbi:hypothetical protein X801_06903 [Opisthorchis viverrini]|uniref:Uncharacterized protein n=1 Tax=Opisthorchis viverrini TaxID=6198 RepID=A0A1S8WS01_OPIVI|nr:hypothetical protein X801_06903 [Opisthorchis viverrini]
MTLLKHPTNDDLANVELRNHREHHRFPGFRVACQSTFAQGNQFRIITAQNANRQPKNWAVARDFVRTIIKRTFGAYIDRVPILISIAQQPRSCVLRTVLVRQSESINPSHNVTCGAWSNYDPRRYVREAVHLRFPGYIAISLSSFPPRFSKRYLAKLVVLGTHLRRSCLASFSR